MSALPMGGPPPMPAGFGAVLAQLAGGQQLLPPFYRQGTPIVPPAQAPDMSPAPGLGAVLSQAAMSQPASPAGGALPPPPAMGGAPASPSAGDDFGAARPRYSKGQIIAGILGDALAGAAGRAPMAAQMWAREREHDRKRADEVVKWRLEQKAKRDEALLPRVEKVGDTLGWLDPQGQKFNPIYSQPEAFEDYAKALGFQPGTPEYADAVEDYRLGGWSDPAIENRKDLEQFENQGRSALETERAAHRLRETRERLGVSRENNIRSTDTSRENNIRSNQTSRSNATRRDDTSRRGQDLRRRRGRGGNVTRIVHPTTGQAMILQGNKWVPEK